MGFIRGVLLGKVAARRSAHHSPDPRTGRGGAWTCLAAPATSRGRPMRDVGILGGGVSGLFTAHFLGGDFEVLEADATIGGLSRCFGGEGFRSDIGGHILFSKDKEALSHELAVLGDNIRLGLRANKILYKGLHVKYPFENGIGVLPKEQIVDILHSFVENPHKEKPTNFREW